MLNTTPKSSAWIKKTRPNFRAKLRLFCFPYAGGWSQIYRPWSDLLSDEIELCLIELPGRGPRLCEAPITSFSVLVQEIATNIYPYLDQPFAFFGHSMGALNSPGYCATRDILTRSTYFFRDIGHRTWA